ncbi:MAG: hypothetical protein ABUL72_00500 [Armatimonadota bacterium]
MHRFGRNLFLACLWVLTLCLPCLALADVGISKLEIPPFMLIGGNTYTGKVTLTGPAPAGGAIVSLSAKEYQFATPGTFHVDIPPIVVVQGGTTTAEFQFTTYDPTEAIRGNIEAVYNTAVSIPVFLNHTTVSVVTTNSPVNGRRA